MTTTTTGNGELAFRVVVEGWPESWVTHSSMIDTSKTPKRLPGLSVGRAKIKHICNPVSMEAEVSSFAVTVADLQGYATAAFATRPSLRTYMTSDMTTGSATLNVRATAGWPSSGRLWLDSEAIDYTSTATTRFLGCTRARLDTQLQKHYVTTGGTMRYPEVINRPPTMAGRRAWVYRYEQTDDPTGDGTIFWRGIITKDPTFDGTSWSFAVQPLTVLLDRSVSADLAEPAKPRGIYYPDGFPFCLDLRSDARGGDIRIRLSGFWETNQEFVDAVNAVIAAGSSDTANGAVIRLVADGNEGWHIVKRNQSAPVAVRCTPISRDGISSTQIEPVFIEWPTANTTDFTPVEGPGDASQTYYWMPAPSTLPGAGSVPRGYFGFAPRSISDTTGTYPPTRIYFGGSIDLTGLTGALASWEDFGTFTGTEEWLSINTYDNTLRYIDFIRPRRPAMHGFTSASLPEIRFGRVYTSTLPGELSNLGTYLSGIISAVPNGLNQGAVPPLRAADFEASPVSTIFAAASERVVNDRTYTTFDAVDLMDVVKAECLLAGYAVGLSPTGQIRFFLVQPPVAPGLVSGSPTTSFYSISAPIDDVSWVPQNRGTANQVKVMRGYTPAEDEYSEAPVTVRDVAAFGQSPRPLTVTIEPKSQCSPIESYSEIVDVARRIFAIFAHPYAQISVGADRRYSSRAHGDIVYVTSPRIPDPTTGTLGVRELPMLVIGFEKEAYSPEIRLHGIAVNAPLSGYVPEFQITAQTNITGNQWDLTLSAGTYTISDFFAANYRVRVWEFDGTGGIVTGTVNSVSGSVVRVTFDASAAAITSGTWVLGWAAASAAIVEDQQDHAYLADSTLQVYTGSSNLPAKVFS